MTETRELTPRSRIRISAWPCTTAVQRALLLRFYRSKYGELHGGSTEMRSLWALAYKGLIKLTVCGWYRITQQGRDYVRFGIRKPR